MIRFTQNHEDLSTDMGFQFKFFCDRCGNGHMSSFQGSATGMAGGLLRAAGNLFGGVLGNAGHSAYEIQRAIGGKAHDAAMQKAVQEAMPHFKQCSRCGKWVCPDHCWNGKRGLCEECAPDLEEEMAAAQAVAARDQVWQKAAETDYVSQLNMKAPATAACPHCGAKTQSGKFCHECGGKLQVKSACAGCGHEPEGTPKFCPECGDRMV